MRLILASASPRRADLLRAAGIPFLVHPPDVDERLRAGETPHSAVERLARMKAEACAGAYPADAILGADTAVVAGKEILGKPSGPEDAARMLRLLSGRTHEVLTGVCLVAGGRSAGRVESTLVRVAPLSDAEIAWYAASGEPDDKAGGYAVQGLASRFIEAIEGSYSNVVGLPISSVYAMLMQLGCDILENTRTPSR
jgi:nucleoside triphosphate pyrophosphatase